MMRIAGKYNASKVFTNIKEAEVMPPLSFRPFLKYT